MAYRLNLREVTYALSEALDFVGIDDTLHGKRVAFISAEIGKRLGWGQSRIDDIIMMGMLHNCGVSSTDVHNHLVNTFDWEDSQIHCERGGSLLQKVTIYHQYAPAILYHHTHWKNFPDSVDSQTKENANLIFIADRIDALRVEVGFTTLHEKNEIRSTIQQFADTMFSPLFIDAFLEVSNSDSFWLYLEPEPLNGYLNEWIEIGNNEPVEFDLLKNIAMMFAKVVDAKSTFTAEHTYGVAALARYLSQLYNLSQEEQERIELAAFFHDLGKLRVADAILNKPGPLNEEERAHMNRHGFDSHIILQKIKGFHEIAKIASLHHETLDAQGYPYHLSADQIPVEARILTVADIFQALVQNRPYRSGLNPHEAYRILDQMTDEHKLDPSVTALLYGHLEKCYTYAMALDPFHQESLG